jgi:hypothetical protein
MMPAIEPIPFVVSDDRLEGRTLLADVGAVQVDQRFLSALAMSESGGDPRSIGDGGRAVGLYHIHMSYLNDVNRLFHTSYGSRSRIDPGAAGDMVKKYLGYYGLILAAMPDHRYPTVDDLCMIHKEGLRGYLRLLKTDEGRAHIKAHLEKFHKFYR